MKFEEYFTQLTPDNAHNQFWVTYVKMTNNVLTSFKETSPIKVSLYAPESALSQLEYHTETCAGTERENSCFPHMKQKFQTYRKDGRPATKTISSTPALYAYGFQDFVEVFHTEQEARQYYLENVERCLNEYDRITELSRIEIEEAVIKARADILKPVA